MLGYVLAVANSLAVADQLDLSAPESMPASLAKAMRGMDLGLRELAKQRNQSPHLVLRHTRPLDLFRIGVTLQPGIRGPLPEPDAEPQPTDDSLFEEFMELFGDDSEMEPVIEP